MSNMTIINESPAQKDTIPLLKRNAPRKYDAISEPRFTKPVTVENTVKQESLLNSQLECGKQNSLSSTSEYTTFENCSCSTTLVVKNDGSTARDNFAIERTFLSWLRFSAALVLTGLSLYCRINFVPQPTAPALNSTLDSTLDITIDHNPLGLLLIFSGLLILIWAIVNYFRFQIMLEQKVAIIENGKFNHFIITLIGSLIFMTFFTSIMYGDIASEEKEVNTNHTKTSFVNFIGRWWWC
ncbi:29796_t:CDS:2 [Gigaspora margarita]|uniref:29796_t:CDS:1 n=1 Tax=Gigaspora margarita TaxID=4874 RepID=A0ABN7UEL3_GIGMA|nr:29796_t:CDS:2 [Gigaspora margarita]